MSSLSPDADEIAALASETHLNEIQFAAPPSRDALETLEKEILRKRHDFEVSFYGFYRHRTLNIFALTGPSGCLREAFKPFVNHKTLKDIWVGLGSSKRNRAVHEMFAGS